MTRSGSRVSPLMEECSAFLLLFKCRCLYAGGEVMKTRVIYRKILFLGALSLCWLLIAPNGASAAQKGLNIPPTTSMKAAPKVEPPPPVPPQGALMVGKPLAPVQGPQPEPPTMPRSALGGMKTPKPSMEYGGSRVQGQPKSFFGMPKVEGGQGPAKPGAPIPPSITPKGAAVGIIDDNKPGGAVGIIDDNMPKGAAPGGS